MDPAPAAWPAPGGGDGCRRGCLVGGILLLALVVVGIAAVVILGERVARQIEQDPEGFFGSPCTLADPAAVQRVLGTDATLLATDGLVSGATADFLDRRLLAGDEDCVLFADGVVGRLAVRDGTGHATFAELHDAAAPYLRADISSIGDEAFCTDLDDAGSGGVLVRWGSRIAYVSVVVDGVDAAAACLRAQEVARVLQP